MNPRKANFGLILLLVIPLALGACTSLDVQAGPNLNLTILYTNNIEGELDPCTCVIDSAGGAARRSSAVNQLRLQNPNLFLVDAGDSLFGTPESNANRGIVSVKAMTMTGYDAAALGDQDFAFGLDVLQSVIDQAEFPFLAANVVYKDTGLPFAQESIIIERNGFRVAFLGLTSGDLAEILNADPVMSDLLEVRDPIKTARVKLPLLREQADMVVILSHLGSKLDQKLAKSVSGIAAVIGGHSREVIQLENKPVTVPIVQMGFQGDQLGVLMLEVDSAGKTVSARSEAIRLNKDVGTDEKILALILPYKAQAALHGLIDFSQGLSPLLPLEVHRADLDTQRAYLGALAYPDLFSAEPYPGTQDSKEKALLACFVEGSVREDGPIDFSLLAISEPGCVQQATVLISDLPELELPPRVVNP